MYADVSFVNSLIMIVSGLWILTWSANRFVDGAATLSQKFGVSPFIIGMVVIGFGTSAPEMAVSALSAASGHSDLSLGNAYGSNIYNIAVILGAVALIRPIMTHTFTSLVSAVMLVAVSLISGFLVWHGGGFTRFDAILSLIAFAVLLPVSCHLERKNGANTQQDAAEIVPVRFPLLWTLLGLALLVGSSHLLVWGAVDIARALGISELMVGLTIVAAETSLPELASAVVSARKGQNDFVMGNIIGSNFFNTLAVVGVSGLVRPFTYEGGYVLSRDLWMMVALSASIALFGCSFSRRKEGVIGRLKGFVWVIIFFVYFALLLIQEHG